MLRSAIARRLEPLGGAINIRFLDERMRSRVVWALERVLVVVLLAECGAVFWGAFTRYILNDPAAWTEEVGRLTLAWLTFVGAGFASFKGVHMRVDLLHRRLTPSQQAGLDAAGSTAVVAFCAVLIGPSVELTIARTTNAASSLGPLDGLFVAPVVIGLALIGLHALLSVLSLPARPTLAALAALTALALAAVLAGDAVGEVLRTANPFVVLFGGFLLLLALHVPIAFAMGIVSLLFVIGIGTLPYPIVTQRLVAGIDSFVLLSVPLFLLAGGLMDRGGITRRLANLALALVGHVRGGLGQVTVVAEYIFSGISGSTTADVAAIGSVTIPLMTRSNYPKSEAVSIVAASAAMGILVPPSIVMLVLGTLVNVSIADLFVAGFLPAAALAACLMVFIYLKARHYGWPTAPAVPRRQLPSVFMHAVPPLITPLLIVGGILSGAVTVTESAMLAVMYGLLLGVVYRELNWRELWAIMREQAAGIGMIMWLIANATLFGWLMTIQGVPQDIGDWIASVSASPLVFLFLTAALYLIFSDILEGLPALMIFSTILYPVALELGIDPVHFGIVSIASLGLGFFLPPAGLGLLLCCSLADLKPEHAWRTFLPYAAVLLFGIMLLIVFPEITLIGLSLLGRR